MQPEQVRTAAQARAIVEERGLAARQGRCVRQRRHSARQIYRSRQVLCSARPGLGLLRCGAGLGFERPAIRQRQLHRLAHRLPGCARYACCRTPAARCRWKATCCCFWGNSPEAPNRCARARYCGACCSERPAWATAPRRLRNSSSSCSMRRPVSVRDKGYRGLTNLTPGYFGYSMLRTWRARRALPGAAAACRRYAHADRRTAYRDRSRRDRSRAALHRGAGGRGPGRTVQDFRQGAGAAARPDGHLHGQVVAAAARPERPSAPVAGAHRWLGGVLR